MEKTMINPWPGYVDDVLLDLWGALGDLEGRTLKSCRAEGFVAGLRDLNMHPAWIESEAQRRNFERGVKAGRRVRGLASKGTHGSI